MVEEPIELIAEYSDILEKPDTKSVPLAINETMSILHIHTNELFESEE